MSSLQVIKFEEITLNKSKKKDPKYIIIQKNQKTEKYKPKTMNINKFLTRCVYNEQKKNVKLEKKRFQKMMEEQSSFKNQPTSTTGSIEKNNSKKKKTLYLKVNKSFDNRKNKKKDNKKNNTIEVNKSNKILNINEHNKYKNRNLNTIQLDKLYVHKKNEKNKNKSNREECKNQKEKKDKDKDSLLKNKSKNKNKNKKNDNNKAKYKHDKILNGHYNNYELHILKKQFLQRQNSFKYQPEINNTKRYRNIPSKYKKISQYNNNIEKKYYHSEDKEEISIENKNRNMTHRSVEINLRKYNLNTKDYNLRLVKSSIFVEEKPWIKSLKRINKELAADDITYHLNIRESTSCNKNVLNNVPYDIKFKEIIQNFIE